MTHPTVLEKAREGLRNKFVAILSPAIDARAPYAKYMIDALVTEALSALDAALAGQPGGDAGKYFIATNEPQTSTAEPDIISGILLMTPEDVAKLWRRAHPGFNGTDEEAIDEYRVVNWAWDWPVRAASPAAPAPEGIGALVKRLRSLAQECRADPIHMPDGTPATEAARALASLSARVAELEAPVRTKSVQEALDRLAVRFAVAAADATFAKVEKLREEIKDAALAEYCREGEER